LGVQGDKLCSYTLSVIVEKNFTDDNPVDPVNNKTNVSISWFTLNQDKPQQFTLHEKKSKTYFRFIIDTTITKIVPNITFTIKPMIGQFKIYLSKTKEPLPS